MRPTSNLPGGFETPLQSEQNSKFIFRLLENNCRATIKQFYGEKFTVLVDFLRRYWQFSEPTRREHLKFSADGTLLCQLFRYWVLAGIPSRVRLIRPNTTGEYPDQRKHPNSPWERVNLPPRQGCFGVNCQLSNFWRGVSPHPESRSKGMYFYQYTTAPRQEFK